MDNLDPNTPVPGAGVAPAAPAGAPAAPSKYETLAQKKGFKSQEDLAGSYENLEQEHSRKTNIVDKAKKQLEAAGYTLNDDGTIEQAGQPAGAPAYPPQGYPQGQPQGEVIYDPYTGQQITDPVALQLARMPLGQREYVVANAIAEQRERQQSAAYQADSEILTKPEAKGFEDDVRKAMLQKPLALRADKNEWSRTLYEIKGKRYDTDSKNWRSQGAEDFINKEGIQGVGGQPNVDTSGVQLSTEQEQQYRSYQKMQPGVFKTRAEFLQAVSPSYGR